MPRSFFDSVDLRPRRPDGDADNAARGQSRSSGLSRWLLCVAGLLMLAGCSGCPDKNAEPTRVDKKPFAGLELRIAVPAGLGLPAAWEIDVDEWSARNNATCQFLEYDRSDTESAWSKRLGVSSGEAGPALLVFPVTEIGELAADDILAPIPQNLQSPVFLNWKDLFQGLRETVGNLGQQPSILPVASPVLVGYYRKDLFERENLRPPSTWQEYRSLLNALGDRGLQAVEPWGEEFRATMFLSRAAAYAKHPYQYSLFFDIDSGRPLIDGPGFVLALRRARHDVRQLKESADVTTYRPDDCRREFFSGRAAMAITFETPEASRGEIARPDSMRVGFFRLPGSGQVYNTSTEQWEKPPEGEVNRVTLTAFRGWCVGVSARVTEQQRRAAWNFLSQIAVDANALFRAFPGRTKSPCRQSHLSRTDAWVGPELSPGEAREYLAVVGESLRDRSLVAELPVPARNRFRESLTGALTEALTTETPPDKALEAAAGTWNQVTEEVGRRRLANGYRRCLGLFPLADTAQ